MSFQRKRIESLVAHQQARDEDGFHKTKILALPTLLVTSTTT